MSEIIVPQDVADEETREIYAEITKVFGNVPIPYRALAIRPDIFANFWALAKRVFESKVIDWDTKLMVALDVAATDGCTSCIGGYRTMLKDIGLTDPGIDLIEHKMISNDLNEKVQSALIYSYAITKDPHDINKNGLASFRRRLTDQEMVEIVSTVNIFRSIIETTHALSLHRQETNRV